MAGHKKPKTSKSVFALLDGAPLLRSFAVSLANYPPLHGPITSQGKAIVQLAAILAHRLSRALVQEISALKELEVARFHLGAGDKSGWRYVPLSRLGAALACDFSPSSPLYPKNCGEEAQLLSLASSFVDDVADFIVGEGVRVLHTSHWRLDKGWDNVGSDRCFAANFLDEKAAR